MKEATLFCADVKLITAPPTQEIRVQLSTYESFQNQESVIQTQKRKWVSKMKENHFQNM
jgi:hypothetical protein